MLRRLLGDLRAGDILLLHDGNSALTTSGTPVILEVLHRGPLVVTDQRVLALEGQQWTWDDTIEVVFAEASGCGAIVLPTAAALATGARPWALLPPSLLDEDPPPRHVTLASLIMWNRVVAAWRASRGELDSWLLETGNAMRRIT